MILQEFDGVYGPAWHCIVGTSFGSFVTHSVGGFLYFSMDQKLYILLFKTSVQRADWSVEVQNTAGKSNKFGILEFKKGKTDCSSEYLYIGFDKKHTSNTKYSLQFV